jgi:glycosyltransferase involved in cell wall biosynthesis
MTQPLLSIIIPVYNGQKYLQECFESILEQSFCDYEVVIVNDGSVDASEDICKAFVEKDKRFHLFTTENRGVSHARNYGMKQAAGQWVMFLDCDDYLLEESLSPLMELADEGTEEVCANYFSENSYGYTGANEEIPSEYVMTMILDPVNNRLLPEFYHLECATLLGVWGKLFRRDLIEKYDLKFDEQLKLSEDMLFHLHYLSKISKVRLSDCPVFYYRQHEASVTRNFKEEHLANRYYLFEQLEKINKKDAVFVISTMLQLAGYVEKDTSGKQKKGLRRELRRFFEEHEELLKEGSKKTLSAGKWQSKVYKICVRLLLSHLYLLEEAFLHMYVKIS